MRIRYIKRIYIKCHTNTTSTAKKYFMIAKDAKNRERKGIDNGDRY